MGPRTINATIAITAFCVGAAMSFFTLPVWVVFAINFSKEGTRTDWLGFLGSIVGACVTLIAATIAWFAVQKQIIAAQQIEAQRAASEEARTNAKYAEAKVVARVAITQCVHAATGMLFAVRNAIVAVSVGDQTRWDLATNRANNQLEETLAHFVVRDIASELEIIDRLNYLMIVSRLSTIVNIYKHPPGILSRAKLLPQLQRDLEGLHTYLKNFDTELADVFEQDGIRRPI
jgi:hypothetical protein